MMLDCAILHANHVMMELAQFAGDNALRVNTIAVLFVSMDLSNAPRKSRIL